jgi:hypothetical protein
LLLTDDRALVQAAPGPGVSAAGYFGWPPMPRRLRSRHLAPGRLAPSGTFLLPLPSGQVLA